MRVLIRCAGMLLLMTLRAAAQQPPTTPLPSKTDHASAPAPLEAMFAANVKTEWDAFKNKYKKAYSDLLADDFAAVEHDSQGVSTMQAAAAEIDCSGFVSCELFQ